MPPTDLSFDAFMILRDAFFDAEAKPVPFKLPPKGSTQDDPFDVYVANLLSAKLDGATCQRSPGPNTNPDMVIYRPEECAAAGRDALKDDLARIVAIEVKKLDRGTGGQVARSSGLDFNTTPPCGTVRIYDASDSPLDIHGYYLFVCQESATGDRVQLTALALCDGDILNRDFDLYLKVAGIRNKTIGLGTYGDGIDRQRPMLVFANPLGAPQLDRAATLISRAEPPATDPRIKEIYQFGRTEVAGTVGRFHAYRKREDIPAGWTPLHFLDPFPQPNRRQAVTQGRGRFRIAVSCAS